MSVKSVGRIFCVGRNYAQHAQELGNTLPKHPIIFMKPVTCLVYPGQEIVFPKHGQDLHQEAELVIEIGQYGAPTTQEAALACISGLTLGLDLTLRDVQKTLQQQGLPWEIAKAFEGSAPIGFMTPMTAAIDLEDIHFTCEMNGQRRQEGHTAQMHFSVLEIILYLASIWRLEPGDLIYTGTPAGVGPVVVGDTLCVQSPVLGEFSWTISA